MKGRSRGERRSVVEGDLWKGGKALVFGRGRVVARGFIAAYKQKEKKKCVSKTTFVSLSILLPPVPILPL
jgi:hypothetical protein